MQETLRIAVSLSSALNFLHNSFNSQIHVIHRDIKPDNIGLTTGGVVKLFDFGLCSVVRRLRDSSEQYKLTGNTGTMRYMAPEVLLGRAYNHSVDAYSFGVVMWQVSYDIHYIR
jgi:serine/threonine protein kinase